MSIVPKGIEGVDELKTQNLACLFPYFTFFFSFPAPSYPQASVVQPCVSTGVVTFPEEQNQTPVVHPTHIMEPQSYDEHHSIRNPPIRRGLSQEEVAER